MPIPIVVITGRPNVGKSSIFNMLARSRIAIVDAFPGVTRDRIATVLTHDALTFELVDTGGVGIVDSQGLEEDVFTQIEIAFAEADLILFVVDALDGIMPGDADLARRLRQLGRPVVLVVNKTESSRALAAVPDFASLGFESPLSTSVVARTGRNDLLERISSELASRGDAAETAPPPGTRLAIVGKQNVGKSTLLNYLYGAERVIVSSIPGTTRDSIDVIFQHRGKNYVAIDTAGMRRKKSIEGSVEFYGQARAERAIRRANVVLFLIDAAADISRVDKKLGDLIVSEFKPTIVVVNKWDIATERGIPPDQYRTYFADQLPGIDFAPLAFMSAKTGLNVWKVLSLADELLAQSRQRLSTGQLNRILHDAYARRSPRGAHGRTGKVFYATQIAVSPPTIVLFVNDPALFDRNYLRYLTARLRDAGPYGEIPIRLFLRPRTAQDAPAPD